MIRRQANLVSGTVTTPGFVLGWLIKTDSTGNETMMMVFEDPAHGFVGEYPDTQIQFQDGCPAVIPVID